MSLKSRLVLAALAVGFACSTAASATEKIVYVYDARGRLVEVKRDAAASTVNDNVKACYKYDKAGNRVNVTTNDNTGTPPTCPT